MLPTALLSLILAAPIPPQAVGDTPPLLLSVALPAIHGRRVLEPGMTIPIVITNVSKKPVRLWREWCSWGFYNLSLEFQTADGKTRSIVKKDQVWSKNYPDSAELAPGESILFSETLNGETWKDVGFLKQLEGQTVKMRVLYQVPRDAETDKNQVWYGSLETRFQEYAFTSEK